MIDRYATLRRGLVGAWCPSLSRGGATIADVSRRGQNGVIASPSWQASERWMSLLGGGWASQTSVLTATPSAKFGASASMAIWVKRRTATPATDAGPYGGGSTGLICCDSVGGGSPATHYPWTDGTAYISTFRTTRVDAITLSSAVDRTRWHLVTVTTDGSRWRFYQNGILVSDQAAQASVSVTPSTFSIGRSYGGAGTYFYLDGNWDDCRLYDRALTLHEITLMVAGGRGVGLRPQRHRRGIIPAATTKQISVNVGGSWLPATPYVNVGGTWQAATPYTRQSGAWN